MPAERERTRAFRRRQFVAPHRRRRLLLRLARPFLSALLMVGAPAAVAYWTLTSSLFSLREISVSGAERVQEVWVLRSLRPLRGRHLLWIRLPEIERRLEGHPWVRGVVARKELPDRLEVELTERRPTALLRHGGELLYVDGEGAVIARFDPALGGADLPLLSGVEEPAAAVPAALALAERWRRLDAEWARGLSEIELLGPDDYRLYTESLPFPLRVTEDALAVGQERLAALLPRIRERYPEIAEVDLRFSHQIVVKPAAPPPSHEG